MVSKNIQGMNLQPQKEPDSDPKQASWKKYLNRRTLTVGAMGAFVLGSGAVVANGVGKDTLKSTVNEVTVSVQRTRHGTSFDKKDILLENDSIKEASSKAVDQIAPEWVDNSVEEIRTEVQRQRDVGLDAYVAQWGDTYSNLAEAVNMPLADLLTLNGSPEKPTIYAGDIVDGVLYQLSNADRLSDDNLVSVSTDVGNADRLAKAKAETEARIAAEKKALAEKKKAEKSSKEDEKDSDEESEEDSAEDVEEIATEVLVDSSQTDGVKPAKPEDIKDDVPEVVEGVAEGVENNLDNSKHDVQVMSIKESYRMDPIKYKMEETVDPELPVGKRITLQGGAPGVIRVPLTITTYSDGTVKETEGEGVVLAEAINEIVRVGPSEDDTPTVVTEELQIEYIPYELKEVEDDTLLPGVERVVKQGVVGQKYDLVRFVKDESGKVLEREVIDENFEGVYEPTGFEAVAKEPVNGVLHVGPKERVLSKDEYDRLMEEEQNVTLKQRTNIEYVIPGVEFDTIDGPMTLAEGEQYTTSGGQDGLFRHKSLVYYLNDEIVFRKPVYDSIYSIIKPPIHKITYIAGRDPKDIED